MRCKDRSRESLKSQWARKKASLFSFALLFKDVLMCNHQATRFAESLSDRITSSFLSARSACFAERNLRPKLFSLFSVSSNYMLGTFRLWLKRVPLSGALARSTKKTKHQNLDADPDPQIKQITQTLVSVSIDSPKSLPALVCGEASMSHIEELGEDSRPEMSSLISVRGKFSEPLLGEPPYLSGRSCKSCPKFLSFGSVWVCGYKNPLSTPWHAVASRLGIASGEAWAAKAAVSLVSEASGW
jgi:hypothetical protein